MRKSTSRSFLMPLVAAALWGCQPSEQVDDPVLGGDPAVGSTDASPSAQASMVDSDGRTVGTITIISDGQGRVQLSGVLNLPMVQPGMKGFHVHEEGECDPPNFESAGDHFDPHGAPHGGPDASPDARHSGDLGNVNLDGEGRLHVDLVDTVITLAEGPDQVLGHAVIVHSGEDDFATQPDGDAGDPVACGVILSED